MSELSCADQLAEFALTAVTPQEIFGHAIAISGVYQEVGDEDHDCYYFQNDGSSAIVNRNTLTVETNRPHGQE